MKKLAMVLLSIAIALPSFAFSAEVKNIKVAQEGDEAVATYDLVATSGEQDAEVTVAIIVDGKRRTSDQLHLNGDFGKGVKIGNGKRIVWNATADLPADFDGDINWDVDLAVRSTEMSKIKQSQEASSTSKIRESLAIPDSVYYDGDKAFKAGRMTTSRKLFTEYLRQCPSRDLDSKFLIIDGISKVPVCNFAADAYFGIGETYYNEKDYDNAILAYQEVKYGYPDSNKIPITMLNQAKAFYNIKDNKSAKYLLKLLIESFPKSDESTSAKKILKQIKDQP